VSALEFLTPSADAVARTPMRQLAAKAGARFETRDGWEIPAAYERAGSTPDDERTVAFADRSYLTKIELHGPHDVRLELGTASLLDGNWWCPVTPSRVLVVGGSSARAAADEAAGEGSTVVDLTCGLAAVALIGPLANELLARFCAIDVRPHMTPVAGFRPGSVARTPGYLLRTADDELLVLVGWALGAYLWEVVADAAAHLGGGPVA
jgi:heterotetrameric sarcosine oxidase gamma subunit